MMKRVLVVDDEPEVTFALQAYFLGEGYEMLTALDGLQAMRYIRERPMDLVLLDMKMPGVNGLEVLKFLHAHSPPTKVIVVTAYGSLENAVQAMREGASDFITKPYDPAHLEVVIDRALERERLHRQTRLLQALHELEGVEGPGP
jgi:DNA-binding NtrC family response regulator